MNNLDKFRGLQDSRSGRGILSRGKPKYRTFGTAPKPKKLFNVQKAAQNRLTQRRKNGY